MPYRTQVISFVALLLLVGGGVACDSGGGSGGNEPPLAAFTYSPQDPTPGEEVTFTDQSEDPDGALANRSWDFGDGEESRTDTSVTHTFPEAGSYEVTLTVTDESGATAETSKTVEVVVDAQTYQNPVVTPVAADPSIIRAPDGTYYLYGTQDAWGDGNGDHYMPIFRSENLVDWTHVGDVFPGIPNWGAG